MKPFRIFLALALVLCLALTACGAPGGSGSDASGSFGPASSAPGTPGSSEPAGSTTQSDQDAGGEDFSSLVFDTSQDAGRLTARYLYLSQMYKPEGEAGVTTGDSTVYTAPDGAVMLVDCGNVLGGGEVVEQLRAMGVERIDIFVASHPHADHIGGFAAVADAFPIGQVYVNGHEYDSGTYRAMMDRIQEDGIPCQTLSAGDEFFLGEEVRVQVFGPPEGDTSQVAGGYQDANDGSIAMRLTYGESSFWTSGDLYISGEQSLIQASGSEIASDVVKMNHHGKDTSNGRDFVDAIQAKVAVGMFDSVASRTVAMRYEAAGAQVFYNSTDGAVRVSTAGDGTYEIQTQLLRDVSILPEPSPDGSYQIG